MKYIPPANFAPVERRLYRSAAPLPISFPFLKLLGIKTIIWLAHDDPSDPLLDFVDENDIRLEHLGLLTEGAKPWDPIHTSTLQEALELMIDPENYPVLLCCGMGRHRTGAVVGCLRKLQGWSFASLADEYQRFTGLKSERSNVELTVENFNLAPITAHLLHRKSLMLPIPPWLQWKLDQLEAQAQAAAEARINGTEAWAFGAGPVRAVSEGPSAYSPRKDALSKHEHGDKHVREEKQGHSDTHRHEHKYENKHEHGDKNVHGATRDGAGNANGQKR